jgi:hypothetical protein
MSIDQEEVGMNNRTFVWVLFCSWAVMQSSLFAATVPAGTTLIVRTLGAISSHAKTGRPFTGTLDQDIIVSGKAVLRAGTHVSGVIEASRSSRSHTSSEPLTLNLTAVSANGRMLPVKTTAGFEPQAPMKTARQSRAGGFSVGETIFPSGTRLEFRLAEPLNL